MRSVDMIDSATRSGQTWLVALLRNYKRALLVAFALSPVPLIAYLRVFAPATAHYHNHLAHEIIISVAIAISAAITYVSYRCYRASGEPVLRWLTLGLLAMTLIYAPHGALTRLAADNPPLFLLFGPASRCVMALLWLRAFALVTQAPDPIGPGEHKARWWPFLVAFLLIDLAVLVIAADTSMPRMAVRYLFEYGAIGLNGLALMLLLRHRHLSPLLQFFTISLSFFILSSISFLLAKPWDHQWWLAHAIFATGFVTMSFGLVRAFLNTGNLIEVFSEDQLIRRLELLATSDELTGLPNRREFMRRFDDELERRNAGPFAVMLLDLDNFKVINDSLGHEAGDELLKTMSQRLQSVLRKQDTLARLGGDEFALIAPGADSATQTARTAERLFDALKEPILFEGKRIIAKASIGIALYPEDGADAGSLLKAADAAMYESKRLRRHRYSFHTPAMNARAIARLQVEHELRDGLRLGQFRLYYQPQLELHNGRICGAEALLRWNHPTRGLISAGAFIGIAEESGIIHELGVWVLRQACIDLATLKPILPGHFRLAVNLSGQQLLAADACPRILQIIQDSDIDHAQLAIELEVTESTLMGSPDVLALLHTLREHDIQLAIDDFGTGYSSLAQLHELPVNRLKIAGTFVAQVEHNESSRSVIRTIVQLGRDLDLAVLAEGIETEAQADFLRTAGCDEAQGFLFHPALPITELRALFSGDNPYQMLNDAS